MKTSPLIKLERKIYINSIELGTSNTICGFFFFAYVIVFFTGVISLEKGKRATEVFNHAIEIINCKPKIVSRSSFGYDKSTN
ncbi:hypothetical protein BCR32DRAFT_277822 [Anaeromyces robustus]|uniref:Uncharacterized protein n=1 Tax=Anaeromyces robustus TaxID=1754192 RepID=A0A1Y1XD39_9FUNG|nr:hypothetical protein BCR32DRAFT_277822 [Anaeromyces robustus]|eukprot:ORX83659.1 hypothetical protein BCR32DRAFT_277822 [Anaeromyces robustus]